MPGGPDQSSRPLSSAGLAQAEALAASLAAYRPVRVLSSPYLRAVQTVAPAAALLGLPVVPRDDLREWESGIGPTPDWQPHYRRSWDAPSWSVPDGETHDALGVRALRALREVEALPGTSVVASHGTWIARALHALGCPVDADFWFAMPMPAVYVVVQGSAPSGPNL